MLLGMFNVSYEAAKKFSFEIVLMYSLLTLKTLRGVGGGGAGGAGGYDLPKIESLEGGGEGGVPKILFGGKSLASSAFWVSHTRFSS